jgi:flavin-dependent dehydrogenase
MNPQREHAIHNERPIRIICIGAGPSGLCFAYKLQRSFQNFSLTVCDICGLTGNQFHSENVGQKYTN